MSNSNKNSTALANKTANMSTDQPVIVPKTADRLSVELDFARVSQGTETSTSQPHILFSPVHYEPGYSYPLFVWLHGTGGNERQIMRIMPVLSMRNYVAIAPQGFDYSEQTDPNSAGQEAAADWNPIDVPSLLRNARRSKPLWDWSEVGNGISEAEQRVFDCIAITRQRNNIDPNRVFLAGYGTGGSMALRLALLNPEAFAGVASLGGAYPQGNRLLHRWDAARKLNVFLGAGKASEAFSPDDVCRALELMHTAGVPVTVREYDCGQELIPAMLQDLNRWMMGIVCD